LIITFSLNHLSKSRPTEEIGIGTPLEEELEMNKFALLLAAAIPLSAMTFSAQAQDGWPTRPVTMIVPYAPGGNNDIIARTLSQPLSEILGQPVVVENRAGAGGTVGIGEAAGKAPDGYTLAIGDISTMAIAPHIYDELTYDPAADFSTVIQITSVPLVLGVGPKLGVSTYEEFMEKVKADPELLDYASSGSGSSQHLAFEYFKSLSGVEAIHIPYNGSAPLRTALIAGEVGAAIDGTLISSIEEGTVTALAITGSERVASLPDVPTLVELGVEDMVYTSWHGVFAPSGTDPEIIQTLNDALNEILDRPEIQERFAALNIDLVGGTPEEFASFIADQTKMLGELVELSGASSQ
jgi:tripartite-type tricarboxylate transporter receptor subunit TctC